MLTASCLLMLPCKGREGGRGRIGRIILAVSLSLLDTHTWLFSLTRKAWNLERRGDLRMNFLVSGTCQARRLGYLDKR